MKFEIKMSISTRLDNPTIFNAPSSESAAGGDENANPYHSHPNSPLPPRQTKVEDKMSSSMQIETSAGPFSLVTSPKPNASNKGMKGALSPILVSTSGRAEDSPGNVAPLDRYQHAMSMQKRRNKERVQKLKSEPSRKLTSYDMQDAEKAFSSPAKISLVKQISSGNLTPNKVWTDAVQNLRPKATSNNRDSQSFVRKIDAFRVASTRIGEWEEHSVQFPTASELAALWRKISGFSRCTMEEQENFLLRSMDEDDSVRVMLLGAVKIIRLQSPSETVKKYLDKTMQHPTRYVGVGSQIMPRSNVRIVAMLSRLRAGDYAAFLLAKPMPGYEHEEFSNLGVHVLSLVTDQGPRLKVMQANVELVDGRRKMSAKLLRSVPFVEKLNIKHDDNEQQVDHVESGEIVTADNGDFNFGDVYEEDCDMEFLLERVDSQDGDCAQTNEVKDEGFESIPMQGNEQHQAKKEAWESQVNEEQHIVERNQALKARIDAMAPSLLLGMMSRNSIRTLDDRRSSPLMTVSQYDDSYERDDNAQEVSQDQVQDYEIPHEEQLQQQMQPLTSSSEAELEEESVEELFLEDVNSPLPNRAKSRPLSHEKATPPAAGMDYLLSSTSMKHEELDSTSQSTSSQAFLQLDLESIDEICCGDRLFVTSSHQQCSSTVISGNLKQVVTQKQSKFVVQDHRVFEWIKGVACSGWMNKLPASSHGWGRPVRRYFLLRENVLTYSNDKPFDDGDQRGANKKLILGEDTTLEHFTIMFMPCLRIRTVDGEELYLKLRPGSRKESLWTQALIRTIALQKTKREALSTTIKTLWLDERDVFELISVDAQNAVVGEDPGHSNSNGYIKVALFKCREDIKAGPMFSIHSTSSIRSLSTHGFEPQLMYCLEILGGDHDHDENAEEGDMKLKLPLVKTNESSFTTPASQPLHCVKIYGDKIILGGAGGSIFVGTIGKATDLSLNRGAKVVYVIPCRDNLDNNAVMLTSSTQKSSSRHTSSKGLLKSNLNSANSSSMIGNGVHSGASTVLFLAWEATNEIFVAVDNHRLISFWQLDRGHGNALNPSSFGSDKKRPGHYYSIKPEYQSSFDLCRADPKGIYRHEAVLGAYFLPESGRLIVSTSQRLLLLIVTYDCRHRLMAVQGEVPVSSYEYYSACCFGVSAYTQLDQVDDVETQRGLFGLQVIDPVQQLQMLQPQGHHPSPLQQQGSSMSSQLASKNSPYRTDEAMKERRLSHRSMSFDHQQLPQRRVVHWRFLSDTTGDGPKHLCQVTRQEWPRERYSQAVRMAIGVGANPAT